MPSPCRAAPLAAMVLMASLAHGCGEGSLDLTRPPPASTNGTGLVTPAGGSVSLGNQAGVTVPPGAVDGPVTITIAPVATPADLQSVRAIGQAYRFAPEGSRFDLPVEIFVLAPDAILAGYDIGSLTLRSSDGQAGSLASETETLSDIRSEPVAGGIIVRGLTRHFSVISVGADRLPLVDAGPDRSVSVGAVVEVTGVGSDPDGGSVAFSWTIQRKPAQSETALTNPESAMTRFTPDVTGEYVLALTVSKPGGASTMDEVKFTAVPAGSAGTHPTADAGPDRSTPPNSIVRLDGSASSGAEPLSFGWRFLEFPGFTAPLLLGSETRSPSFTPQVTGTYVLELTVANPFGSAIDEVAITVNSPPVAALTSPEGVKIGGQVNVIDASTDPDGDPLTRAWFFLSPTGSNARLTTSAGQATFTSDIAGHYTVGIRVSDGKAISETSVIVAAVPDVSGTYTATFVVDPAPACGVVEPRTFGPGSLPITQDQDRITLQIEAISAGQATNATGRIAPDGSFDFMAPMRFVVDGSTYNASPRWTGAFDPSGEVDARFIVNAVLCTITGSLDGVRQ